MQDAEHLRELLKETHVLAQTVPWACTGFDSLGLPLLRARPWIGSHVVLEFLDLEAGFQDAAATFPVFKFWDWGSMAFGLADTTKV